MTIFLVSFTIIGVLMISGSIIYQSWALRNGRVNQDIDPIEEDPFSFVHVSQMSYMFRQKTEHIWHIGVLYGTSSLMWTIRLIEKKLRAIVQKTYDKLHGVRSTAHKKATLVKKEPSHIFDSVVENTTKEVSKVEKE